MEILFFTILILSIIILSGIISGSEAALLSVSYTKTKEILSNSNNGRKKAAEKLVHVKENIQEYISTIVVLNNVVNIVGSIYVGVLASNIFGEIYLGLVSALLTFAIIIFSEIIPKVYGENHCETISLKIVSSLIFFTKFFKPIIFLLNRISKFFVKEKIGSSISEGEIKEMAILGEKEGSINSYESDVINNVFEMNDTDTYDIMIPKTDVVVLDSTSSYSDVIKVAQKTGYTRFPIIENREIVGVINIKDLFRYHGNENKFDIIKILRPVFYAPESMKIFTLQEKLKKEKTHIAIIVNEHGDFTGIVTLEDIIEELLGEIEDEFDREEISEIKKITENKYHILATCDINDLNEKFDLDIFEEEDEEFTTLNGYLSTKLDKIPKVNDKIKTEKYKFRVIKASKRKALEVELILF